MSTKSRRLSALVSAQAGKATVANAQIAKCYMETLAREQVRDHFLLQVTELPPPPSSPVHICIACTGMPFTMFLSRI